MVQGMGASGVHGKIAARPPIYLPVCYQSELGVPKCSCSQVQPLHKEVTSSVPILARRAVPGYSCRDRSFVY